MLINEDIDSINKILDKNLITFCEDKSDHINSILDILSETNKSLVDKLKGKKISDDSLQQILELSRNYQSTKIEHFTSVFSEINMPLYSLQIDDLVVLIDDYLAELPKTQKLEQHKDRFYNTPEDSWFIKLIKVPKRFFYSISISPKLLWNFILKIFKKAPRKIQYWNYNLPYRLLVERFTKTILIKNIDNILSIYSKSLIQILKSALDKEQETNIRLIDFCISKPIDSSASLDIQFDLKDEKNQLSELVKEFKKNIKNLYQNHEGDFNKQLSLAGTIEQPTFLLKYHNRIKRQEYYKKQIHRSNIGWGNTAFGLFEDWKIDQEIFKLISQIRIEVSILENIFTKNTDEIITFIAKSHKEIKEIKDRLIARLSVPKANVTKEIKNEINSLDKHLVQTSVNPAIETIINQNFIGSINEFELKIDQFVSEISDKKWLTKLINYDAPLKNSDLDSFSPHELLSFKYLPELQEACSILKANNIRHVESFKQDISNISGIIAFNLNSILESKEFNNLKNEKTLQLISEGFDRSKNKLNAVQQSLTTYGSDNNKAVDEMVKQFIDSTLELTNNENAFALRIIVTKAKAIQRTVDFRFFIQSKAKQLFVETTKAYKKQEIVFNKFIKPWKRRFGISGSNEYIATELSDFLSEAIYKINRLPIVYQQLYKIQPLTEMNLFTGRSQEVAGLSKAYQSWKDGKYAPTVIVGEKWSGHTTLINYFIDKLVGNTKVIYENRLINVSSKDDFLNSWKTILKTENIDSLDELINLINVKHKNKIIIIENIQNYYLRTIKGFDYINLFIKLVSKTYHNVFWLCTANVYAWDYLNSTIEISNYFGYQINMTAFSDDELRQLIMKKNNISGYKIVFQPAEKNLDSKKFNALEPIDKQVYLQNQFFKQLNEFAKGNISLALSYWLLSTKNINEDSIEINNFEPPDFSFISKLNSEKVFLIYLLIMHDGLTLEHLCLVLKKPLEKLHLLVIMLLDDGILIERNGWFEVNPLIYRHSINMLKSRNLIY